MCVNLKHGRLRGSTGGLLAQTTFEDTKANKQTADHVGVIKIRLQSLKM
jgi:hypothetical protein